MVDFKNVKPQTILIVGVISSVVLIIVGVGIFLLLKSKNKESPVKQVGGRSPEVYLQTFPMKFTPGDFGPSKNFPNITLATKQQLKEAIDNGFKGSGGAIGLNDKNEEVSLFILGGTTITELSKAQATQTVPVHKTENVWVFGIKPIKNEPNVFPFSELKWSRFDPSSPITPSSIIPSPITPSSIIPSPITPSSIIPSSIIPSAITPSSIIPSAITPSSIIPSPITPSSIIPSPITPSSIIPSPITPSSITPSSIIPSAITPSGLREVYSQPLGMKLTPGGLGPIINIMFPNITIATKKQLKEAIDNGFKGSGGAIGLNDKNEDVSLFILGGTTITELSKAQSTQMENVWAFGIKPKPDKHPDAFPFSQLQWSQHNDTSGVFPEVYLQTLRDGLKFTPGDFNEAKKLVFFNNPNITLATKTQINEALDKGLKVCGGGIGINDNNQEVALFVRPGAGPGLDSNNQLNVMLSCGTRSITEKSKAEAKQMVPEYKEQNVWVFGIKPRKIRQPNPLPFNEFKWSQFDP